MGYADEDSNFDLDLDYGTAFEEKIRSIFEDDGSIEVKTERGIWRKTGNIALEITYRGKPSGLATTEAKWWVHVLADGPTILGSIMLPTKLLRSLTEYAVDNDYADIALGGDDNQSGLVLMPIVNLFNAMRSLDA